jgi:hypothetical protein
MTQMFNTPLNQGEQFLFKNWQLKNPGLGNPYDYDAQGFWKGGNAAAANGHGSDQFKKPNHPTFSNQSQYSGPNTGYYGGVWGQQGAKDTFQPTPQQTRMWPQLELGQYFNQYEPGNMLLQPGFPRGMVPTK